MLIFSQDNMSECYEFFKDVGRLNYRPRAYRSLSALGLITKLLKT